MQTPMPPETIQPGARSIFGLCFLAIMGVILLMIRKNAVREKYILLWLPLGLGFFGLSLFPELLVAFSARLHLHYMTVVVLGVILVFTNILLFLTMRLSQLREDVKSLAQEIALSRAGEADAGRLHDPSPNPSQGHFPAWLPSRPIWLRAPREPDQDWDSGDAAPPTA